VSLHICLLPLLKTIFQEPKWGVKNIVEDKNKIDFVWIFLDGQYTLTHTQLNDMYTEIVNRVHSQIRVIISIS